MNFKSFWLPACAALAAACLLPPTSSSGQAGNEEAVIATLIDEIAVQQTLLTENQTKIDAKIATIAEDVRVARIFVTRGGGKTK